MKNLYLAFAIIGAVVPYLFFFDFISSQGLDLPAFLGALFVNGAAGGFTADLLITSTVFWIYMFSRVGGPVAVHRVESDHWVVLRPAGISLRVDNQVARPGLTPSLRGHCRTHKSREAV